MCKLAITLQRVNVVLQIERGKNKHELRTAEKRRSVVSRNIPAFSRQDRILLSILLIFTPRVLCSYVAKKSI